MPKTTTAPRKAAPTKKSAAASTQKSKPKASLEGRSLKEISQGRRDIRKLLLDDIEPLMIPGPNGKPVRFNVRGIDTSDLIVRAQLDELKALLREHGQKEPGRGRMQANGLFGLSDGERRHLALRELRAEDPKDERWQFMEVCPEPQGTADDERDFDLLTCNSGVPLTMLEQGALFRRRKDAGMPVALIAKKAGNKTEQHVYDCLKLVGVDEEVKADVRSGKIAATTVVNIAKKVPADQLKSTVKTTIATAAMRGKSKATNQDVPKLAGRKKAKKKSDPEAAADDLTRHEQEVRKEKAQEFQSDSVGKLTLLRESVLRSRCIADRYDTIPWIIDFIQGTKELPELIDFLKGQEPLL